MNTVQYDLSTLRADSDLACGAVATLKKGEGRSLKAGGQWIYDNEIADITGEFDNGAILAVHDFDGFFMGYGFINVNSRIRIRMLSRRAGTLITPAFLRERTQAAWDYRKDVIDTSSCRLIFGEADWLPGLTVDKFEDVLVVESLALGMDALKMIVLNALREILAADGITIRGIYERSDAKVRALEGMERYKGFIGAEFDTKVKIIENGVKYIVDVKDGQKTGFFLDQKNNRAAIATLCKGRKVLDCFTHTGSFGLNAACAGASSVLAVDASELGLHQAAENAALNGVEDIISFECADVFDLLPRLESEGESYDVVILDPPAFTKSRQATKNAIKGYREINIRGLRLTRNGGYFATCSCSHFMDQDLFTQTIREAARSAHKRLRQIEFRTQAPDHPILWGDSESYYLKFYIFQVMEER
ncbi:MAG: class I SAM-dependent rRNA methyltransferase [Lachnospiraceae bacterium]|nr:class I SAM-dependent rRNA methyltransferase [Lachnospiraceae bacterium]